MAKTDFASLKQYIEIQNQILEVDDCGLPQTKWKTVRKTTAKVTPNSNSKSENNTFDGINFYERKEFIIRKYNGIKGTNCRILYKKDIYNIIHIEDLDEDGMFMFIMGQKVV